MRKLFMVIFLVTGLPAFAIDTSPFYTFNQSPFVQIYGLPGFEGARTLEHGRFSTRASVDIASNYFVSNSASESLALDMETYRSTLAMRYGITDSVEIGMDIPFLAQNQGFLDRAIIQWHDHLGFPQGGRDLAPINDFRFTYTKDGVDIIDMEKGDRGISDIRFTLGYQLFEKLGRRHQNAAVRGLLKLPTGNSDTLLGSGGVDFALGINYEQYDIDGWRTWGWFGALGILMMQKSGVLRDMQNQSVIFNNLGFAWSPWTNITLKAQLDGHTAFYEGSSLKQLSSYATEIVAGGSIRLRRRVYLEFGVSEDIIVHTAPDVNFQFRLLAEF